MGAERVEDKDLTDLGIVIEEKMTDGDRILKISQDKLPQYVGLIKAKLDNGFWNEIVGEKEVFFIFKLKDGSIKEYTLSLENEKEIAELCSRFNGDSLEKTRNVYKYISGNKFYRDFMTEHYADLINRQL